MKFNFQSVLLITLCALAVLVAAPAQAQSDRSGERRSAPEREEEAATPEREWPVPRSRTRQSSLSDAVRRVQRETGGQVLGAERVQFDGRDINRIKVMDDRGRIRYMDDDPQRKREREQREALPARGDNPSPP